jgi:hypothetical protein
MRAMCSAGFAALTVAVSLAGGSLAQAQCPTCPGGGGYGYGYGHGHHGQYRVGEYSRYGGFNPYSYYCRGAIGPYSDAGDCVYRHYGQTDLFRQYYVGNNCGGPGAAMYPAPNTMVPPSVGQVYYTYEPFYPHEWLYPHHRTYHRYYNDGRGLTRTSVHWMKSPTLAALGVIPFHVFP